MKQIKINKWVLTDPAFNQYGRWLGDRRYEFKQDIDSFKTFDDIIDLNDHTEEEILSAIKSFGYKSIEKLKETHGGSSDWITAECLFELSIY